MLDILIVYSSITYPLRTTSRDNVYSFRNYTGYRCYYLNMGFGKVPWYVSKIKFDLILFHDLFVCERWAGESFFKKLLKRSERLKHIAAAKVVVPQDEFIYSDLLCDFINDFNITSVFSVSPQSEWKKIYNTVDFNKVKFFLVLTGYLDDKTINRINNMADNLSLERSIDIGYRAKYHNAWIGRHGMLKSIIADIFQSEAPQRGLNVDISMRPEDTKIGDDWYNFLLSCKYTIGVEGGASILDHDGSIMKKTDKYIAEHPEASFEEIESACFPNRDGELALFAISPRHLEACATRTCQVLIEGDYNGILTANKHYIELKKDFSNLKEVLNLLEKDQIRDKIVEQAYQDIVNSDLYKYGYFANYVIDHSLPSSEMQEKDALSTAVNRFLYSWMLISDKINWMQLAAISSVRKLMPRTLQKKIKKLLGR